MDFPITEYEMSSRHTTGNSSGRAGLNANAGSFADLLSADRFSDLPDGPTLDEIYDELDTLTSREDRTDEDSAYDDADADHNEDDGADDSDADDGRPDNEANERLAENSGSSDSALAGTHQSLDNGANLIGGDTSEVDGPQIAQSAAAQANGTADGLLLTQDQIATAGAANLAEARVVNRRSYTLQANAQHASTVKSQLAKAESSATDTTARTTDTAKTATTTQEASQPKSEAGRLEQVFRAAFPQNSNTPAVTPSSNPALPQSPLTAQTASITDSLISTSAGASAGDGSDTSTQIQNNAERTNNIAATKAAATRSPFTLPGGRPAEQVSVQIQNAARNGTDRISIRLSPAALGKVEVKLELAPDKTVQAIVTAEKPETLDMLERDARTLQRALEEAGLRTNSDSLSFERRDPNGTTDTASNSDRNPSNGTGGSDQAEHDDGSDQVDVELSSRRHHDGLLDVEV